MKNDSKVGLSTRRMGFHVPTKERPGEFALGYVIRLLLRSSSHQFLFSFFFSLFLLFSLFKKKCFIEV